MARKNVLQLEEAVIAAVPVSGAIEFKALKSKLEAQGDGAALALWTGLVAQQRLSASVEIADDGTVSHLISRGGV